MPASAFVVNPLSLCITQSNFEAWLKEKGFLEMLEKCTFDFGGQGSLAAFSRLLKANPLQSLTLRDIRRRPVPWTGEFFDCGLGLVESYSWPISVTQARFRLEENLRRYTGNYLVLSLGTFLCFLYKMPLALLGIACIFGLWEGFRACKTRFNLERRSISFRLLMTLCNFGTLLIVVYARVAVAFFWASCASFVVIAVHSSLRKITRPPPPPAARRSKRS